MKQVYCTYEDTVIASLWVKVQCPYCQFEQQELDLTDCGKSYEIKCDRCEKPYEMHFDES